MSAVIRGKNTGVVTMLFTDIEGSTRLWEKEPEKMRPALARHDAIVRAAVDGNRGTVVKMSGDGVHAAFVDPLDAVRATLELQQALVEPEPTAERVSLCRFAAECTRAWTSGATTTSSAAQSIGRRAS